tara:strand:- start:7096 stop:7461 length:366 start_codon:yes stop_codon:yes gene_type:complete
MSKTLNKAMKKASEVSKKVDKFSDLLDSIETLEDKRKHLWKEIYENALVDRENAGMLFTDIYQEMQGNAMQHTALGPTAAKYLERMCKSNDQILRLAELVAKAEEASSTISPDDIFNEISG